MTTMDDLLTPAETAALLRLKVETLRSWRTTAKRRRPLPFVRVGGRIVYRRVDVLTFLADHAVTPAASEGASFPREARIANRSVIHIAEPASGLLLRPGSFESVTLRDAAHAAAIRGSLQALTRSNHLPGGSLALELEGAT